jgi:hypothetical protein
LSDGYSNWKVEDAYGYRIEECVKLSAKDNTFSDKKCDEMEYFVCKKNVDQIAGCPPGKCLDAYLRNIRVDVRLTFQDLS